MVDMGAAEHPLIATPSALKRTVPVGAPLPELRVTVAVKVTLPPLVDGFCEEATVVVVTTNGRTTSSIHAAFAPLPRLMSRSKDQISVWLPWVIGTVTNCHPSSPDAPTISVGSPHVPPTACGLLVESTKKRKQS